MKKTLKELIQCLETFNATREQFSEKKGQEVIQKITADSREVGPGTLFVAIQGTTLNGHDYIEKAFKAGASLVVGQEKWDGLGKESYLLVKDTRVALAELASSFYGHPSQSLLLVGVTGTSGKTTTTYLIESILKAAGHRVGVIGTIQVRYGEQVILSSHTTPDTLELQRILFEMKKAQCTAVVMEVSSHGLKQKRTANLSFDGMLFTNLSPEHLDFHPDMEDYYQSKKILFTELADYSIAQGKRPVAVVVSEDSYGKRLYNELQGSRPKNLKLVESSFADSQAVRMSLGGIEGEVDGVQFHSPLTGQFNVSNILGALRMAQGLGISAENISKGIGALCGVPGRLERVNNSRGVHVWVDYAHKPDALEKVIRTLNQVKGKNRLITVFGCGGDRDRKKRPIMGKIAVELSDHVLITSDNPRTEDPMSIIEEILQGTQGHQNFTVESDRRKAIHSAIRLAQSGDLVLIAGKGHEDYQIIGKQKIHFDDREVAAQAFDT